MLPHPRLIFSLAYNPYTALGPSSYAFDATLTPPYDSSCPPNIPPTLLTILTLPVPSQHSLPSLRSQCPPDMPLTLLTILTLVECLSDLPPTLLTIFTLRY
ncbi:hypothetical protein O181_020845 [Austropuccinia psidii MF-1]|uniref:Uncharacterized protein n=1 Tax=Austropuccinia psidii MF-1 TaxID=1389203 RepID=A0A9Q3CDE1_9BASI|nr:hypothetical protein [Austropuccinia psidii MF-1]